MKSCVWKTPPSLVLPVRLECQVCNAVIESRSPPEQTYRECGPQTRAPEVLHPCVHRGSRTGMVPCELPDCASRIKVYHCALLPDGCTLSPKITSKQFCGTCPQRHFPGNDPTPES